MPSRGTCCAIHSASSGVGVSVRVVRLFVPRTGDLSARALPSSAEKVPPYASWRSLRSTSHGL
jgi:hypothetical protein